MTINFLYNSQWNPYMVGRWSPSWLMPCKRVLLVLWATHQHSSSGHLYFNGGCHGLFRVCQTCMQARRGKSRFVFGHCWSQPGILCANRYTNWIHAVSDISFTALVSVHILPHDLLLPPKNMPIGGLALSYEWECEHVYMISYHTID